MGKWANFLAQRWAGRRLRSLPAALAAALAAGLAFPAYVAAHALTKSVGLASGAAALVFIALAALVHRFHAERCQVSWRERPRRVVVGLLLVLTAGLLVGKLALFIHDPSIQRASVLPDSEFITHHSCVTAYYEAARLAGEVENVYDPNLYRPGAVARSLDDFVVDFYEYPPPFLLAPRLSALLGGGFLGQRALWFFATLLCLGSASFALATWVGEGRLSGALLLAPALLIALPTRIALQMTNFQLVALGLSVLALLAFERKQSWLGGAALGFAMVSKFFPGVLLVYLLSRRRWRDAAWTIGMALGETLLALAIIGPGPFRSFFEFHLPRLASGEAFPMLSVPFAVVINQSVYGVPLKLGLLGVPGMSFALAGGVAWVYTLGVLVLAWRAGKLELDRPGQARLWICLLGLGALRSPFLPQDYAQMLPLWLLTLLPLGENPRRWLLVGLAWLVLNIGLPMEAYDRLGARGAIGIAAIPWILHWGLLFGTLAVAFRRGRRPAPAPLSPLDEPALTRAPQP